MGTLADYWSDVQSLIHDSAAVDFSTADLTKYVNKARKRVSLDTHCVRKFYTGVNFIALQESYPISGGVGGSTGLVGGSGYSAVSGVTVSAPPAGGTLATATATVTAGAISAISFTNWGLGYTAAPTLAFTGGAGVGASATPTTFINVLDINSVSVLWPSNLQSCTLNWLPFTMFQAFCRANRLTQSVPRVWTTFEEMNLLYVYPIPDQAYSVEMDVITTSTDMTASAQVDSQILTPFDDAVQFYAAYLALLKMQNFEHAGYYEKKYQARIKELIETRRARRIYNVYKNAARRMNRY